MLSNIHSPNHYIEYAAVVWSPHTQSDINTVEMLQRKAARFVFNNFSRSSSVSNMLERLGWAALGQRRNQLTLLMFYKIIHKLVEVPHQHILTKAPASILEVVPTNSFTYIHEKILTNPPSSQGLLDFEILFQIK